MERATQIALVRSVGREMARHGVRVNGIAPNFIENPSYFPPETVADPTFQESLRTAVPAQRMGRGHEAAAVLWWPFRSTADGPSDDDLTARSEAISPCGSGTRP